MSEEGEGSVAEAADVAATVGDSAPESGGGETTSESDVSVEAEGKEESTGPDFVGAFEEPDYAQFEDLGGDEILPEADDLLDPPEAEEVAAAETQTPEEIIEETAKVEETSEPTGLKEEVKEEIVSPEPAAPATPEPTAEEMKTANDERVAQYMEQLAAQYAFTEDEAANLNDVDAKPSDYLPKLLAKAHMNALVQARQLMMNTVPDMVTETSQHNIDATKAEDSFFGRWPDLKGHEEKVTASIQAYKSVNPDADMEQVIEGAGALTMVSLGKPLEGKPPANVSKVVTPVPPPPPAATGGGTGEIGRPQASYEERVYSEFVNDDQRLAKG